MVGRLAGFMQARGADMGEHAVLRCLITADLALLRDQVRAFAAAAGFSGVRLDDVVLVVGKRRRTCSSTAAAPALSWRATTPAACGSRWSIRPAR